MPHRKLQILTLFVVLFAATIVVGCYKTPGQRAERIVNHIAEKLNLNDTQKAKLNAIKDEFMAKAPAMRKTREETFDEVIAFMRSPKIDQDKANALVEKNKTQTDELIRFIFAKYVEFHDMLTPEQREKAAKEMEQWKERHKGGRY
jgi:Spy/CpxP family protein refolding chaperone